LIFLLNFAEFENLPVISIIFDSMMYFYHGKNFAELPKAVVAQS